MLDWEMLDKMSLLVLVARKHFKHVIKSLPFEL
jgi:hypothetical protein